MTIDRCLARVTTALGKNAKEKDVKKILDELDEYARKDFGDNGTYQEKVREYRQLLMDSLDHQKRESVRRQKLQIIKRSEVKSRIENLRAQGLPLDEAILADLGGSVRIKDGAKNSVDAHQNYLSNKYQTDFIAMLEKENLLQVFNSKGDVEDLLARELYELNREGGTPGVSGNKAVARIAKLYNDHNKLIRKRMRAAGVDTKDLDGFIISQTHNRELMTMAGKDAWKQKIKPLLDYQKTFGTEKIAPEDVDKFLDSAYDALSTGVRRRAVEIDVNEPHLKKPRNMAERLAQSRRIHFKGPKEFLDYNRAFGSYSVQESMMSGLERAGNSTALLERYGPNPRATFDTLRKQYAQAERGTKEAQSIYNKGFWNTIRGRNLEAVFANLDGTAHISANPKTARVNQNIRDFISMSKLGLAAISSLSDIPVAARTLQYHGVDFAGSYATTIADAFRRVPKADRHRFASVMDTYSEATIGAIANRYGLRDGVPGRMTNAMRLFYKWNGLEWWTATHKEGVAAALSHNLFLQKDLTFDQINKNLLSQLKAFDITPEMWDIARTAQHADINGKGYITADFARDLPDDVLAKYIGDLTPSEAQLQKARDEIEDAFGRYFIQTVNDAVLTPGARERSIQNFGYQPGTIEGEFVRNLMLFKSFPATFITRVLGRELWSKGKADIMGLAQIGAMMTAFGAVSMTTKDLLKGQNVRDFKDEKTWLAAFLQGGGAGIFGDFMFGQYNRFGQSFVETAAGPVYGGLYNDLASLYSSLRDDAIAEGDLKKFAANVVGTAKGYVPFSGLPFVGMGFNYLFAYQIQEALSPGYLRRMEKRLEKERGITFAVKPSEVSTELRDATN